MTAQAEKQRHYVIEQPEQEISVEMTPITVLSQADQKRIEGFVTFDPGFDASIIISARGRNVLFPLVNPKIQYDAVQVSGAGFFDIGIIANRQPLVEYSFPHVMTVQPPKANPEEFTHTTDIVENGNITTIRQVSPMGSYTQKSAAEKYLNTSKIYLMAGEDSFPFFVPRPISLIRYPDFPDGVGGKQSALVFVCPDTGLRADDFLYNLVHTAKTYTDPGQREEFVKNYWLQNFLPVFPLVGRAARWLHENGLCHYQMTLGNVSPALLSKDGYERICLYDWETLRPVDKVDPRLSKIYDISVPIASSSVMIGGLWKMLDLSSDLTLSLSYSGLVHFLVGYTNQPLAEAVSQLKLTGREAAQVTLADAEDIVKGMMEIVLPRLKNNPL